MRRPRAAKPQEDLVNSAIRLTFVWECDVTWGWGGTRSQSMKGLNPARELSLHPAGREGPVVHAFLHSVSLHEHLLCARPEKSVVNKIPAFVKLPGFPGAGGRESRRWTVNKV